MGERIVIPKRYGGTKTSLSEVEMTQETRAEQRSLRIGDPKGDGDT